MGGPGGRSQPDWGAVSLLGAQWAVAACPPGSGRLEGLQHPDPSTFIDWALLAEVTARSARAALASAASAGCRGRAVRRSDRRVDRSDAGVSQAKGAKKVTVGQRNFDEPSWLLSAAR